MEERTDAGAGIEIIRQHSTVGRYCLVEVGAIGSTW